MAWEFSNDKPVYVQITEEILIRIVSAQYSMGEKLPSVRELAQEACVNPNTMQRALSELENCGLLISQRTSGRFVTTDKSIIEKMQEDFAETYLKDFLEKMTKLGFSKENLINLINSKEG